MGKKVAKKGYNLPYSAGLSVNYFWQDSEITIKNLQVGFSNGPLYDLDEIVRFDKSSVEAGAITIRPDIWLLPFLNVYGIFGKAKPTTKINAGIWIPDADNNWSQIASFNTKANFDATTFGFGLTPTIGIGGGRLALDMNMSWLALWINLLSLIFLALDWVKRLNYVNLKEILLYGLAVLGFILKEIRREI